MSNPESTHIPDGWNVDLDAFEQDGTDQPTALACWLFLHDPLVRNDIEAQQ